MRKKMSKYTVEVKEVHVLYIEVEANSKEGAKAEALALMLENDYTDSQYDHTMDSDHWNVYPA